MSKEQYRGTNAGHRISELCFAVPDQHMIRRQSHIQCINNSLYDSSQSVGKNRKPAAFGVLDNRLGSSQKDVRCDTCGQSLVECIGHFGYIDMQLPVFHTGYFRFVLSVLQCVCKRCSRFMFSPASRQQLLLRIRRPDLSYLEKKAMHKDIVAQCKKLKECPFCHFKNGNVKKVGLFKILHVFPVTKAEAENEKSEMNKLIASLFFMNQKEQQDLIDCLKKSKGELLDPIRVRMMLSQIPDEDLPFLLIHNFRPEDMIVTRVAVPPACIRPSVINDLDASNEDDLTIKLSEIIFVNDVIAKRKASGAQMSMLVEDWDFLQLHLALYINSETSGIPFSMRPKKQTRGLVQRLKGKHGRFRGNLSGKRVDFSSRSVISPNPNLQIDEVGVPEFIAKILTFPEKVNATNIEMLRKLVLNGADEHPGANFIEDTDGGRVFLRYGSRIEAARRLRIGDTVERHLCDGDKVLFNRQPSLHKLSIMCHTARVHKHRTLQFNECVCTPYNADFDGDEMNLHLPQTLEARAEATVLMGIKNNIVTPRNGEPLIAAIQDFITGSFLMSHKDTFFDRAKAMQLIGFLQAGPESDTFIDLPPPCIMKPKSLWSGKQIFSLIFVPNNSRRHGLCLSTKTKNYSNTGDDMCVNDGYVVIRNGELLCGAVEKSVLGSGSKNNIFYVLLRDVNSDEAAKAMWRLARVTSYFLLNRGFSLGIDDVTPTKGLIREKGALLRAGYSKVLEYIRNTEDGKLEAQPGQTTEETLEVMVLKELSGIRDVAGKSCIRELGSKNAPLIMAMCGSKGSLINVSQMVACVGQQAIRGARVPNGFGDRSLPYFDHREKTPLAKGFVENSFYSGLTATEFFFHTMAGREGLLDTAVKTAETGYMQRRLVKALEDLVSHYDGSVRNSRGDVVQFVYGDDFLDPVNMEDNNGPVHFERLLSHVRSLHPSPNETLLEPSDILTISDDAIAAWPPSVTDAFKNEVRQFIRKLSDDALRLRHRYQSFFESRATLSMERTTRSQLQQFMARAVDKYLKAVLEPGTAVGAICAQSIGEPATQMTLKTFHFAGVASMNITQGVPRIKELINANKTIATPIITAALHRPLDPEEARSVKMRLEKTTLGQICESLDQVVLRDDAFVLVKMSKSRIRLLRLEVNEESICEAISKQLKIPSPRLEIPADNHIVVRPKTPSDLWHLRETLMSVVVKGIRTIRRAAIRKERDDTHYLMIEGEGLRQVMATYGVRPESTVSNNVMEVAATLGIEAARSTIIKEIRSTMQSHGIGIDERHLKLLADTMTYRGEVLGITRFGLAKMKESALMLASFEKTADHLFDAAYFNQRDAIIGVSESIISGVAMKPGTGFFDLLLEPHHDMAEFQRKALFDDDTLHDPFRT